MDRDQFNHSTAAYDHWCRIREAWVGPLLAAFALALFCQAYLAITVFGIACLWWGGANLRAQHWYRLWKQGVRH